VKDKVDNGLKLIMLELYLMGIEDFDLNMAGCLHAVENGVS
jgi:hypothetical protein